MRSQLHGVPCICTHTRTIPLVALARSVASAQTAEEVTSTGPGGGVETESKEDPVKGGAMTSSASSPTETSTETILVVDDDSEVLSVAEDMSRSMRYSVIGTMDPYVALRFCLHPSQRNPSSLDGRSDAADGNYARQSGEKRDCDQTRD